MVPANVPFLDYDVLHFNLVVHSLDNLLDGILYVEQANILREILRVFFQDGIVQNVMDEEVNELGGRVH